MSTEKIKKLNTGHRNRLKKRFEKSGFKGFNDYEILEFMLFPAITRKDTKPIAKALIKKFKSINAVLNADLKDITMIEGIGKNVALYIKSLNLFYAYLFEEKAILNEIQFTQLDELVDYFRVTIGSLSNEVVKVLYLNSMNKMIHSEIISEGTVTNAYTSPRKIVENALFHKATTVIMAHNHPGGLAEPSEIDDDITEQTKIALNTVEISLQEHIIITGSDYYSYRRAGKL